MRKVLLIILFAIVSSQAKPQSWSVNFGDSLWYYDPQNYFELGIGELYTHNYKLFVYGGFTRIGSDTAINLAYWNGQYWKSIVIDGGPFDLRDMKYYKGCLYLCGPFQQLNNVANLSNLAKWDGQNWDSIPKGSLSSALDHPYTLSWLHDTMFLGGTIGIYLSNFRFVIQWDGTNWITMEHGIDDDNALVLTSVVYNDQIHIGGCFNYVSGHPIKAVARWDGQHWQPLGSGLYEQVQSMYVDTIANVLYAGGFLGVPDSTGTHFGMLAKWDGQSWTLMDSSIGNIGSIITYRGKLFVGGNFDTIGHKPIKFLAKWNGNSWDSIATGIIGGGIGAMAVFNDELIVGGMFSKINGLHATGIARYYEPPDTACIYFNPAIYTDADTFYLHNDTVSVPFFNNNSHANSWQWNFGDSGTDTVWSPVHIYHQPGVFNVTVHVTELWCNGTAQKTIVISDIYNKIPETKKQEATLQIFPNPANNSITIEITGAAAPFRRCTEFIEVESKGSGGSELRITDQQGKLVKTIQIKESNSKTEIITKSWAKGTYLCNLIQGGKTVKAEKLVIE
ncbi:MAG: T9SS type A sorting domain-containing protein [Bacteroidia bacterium]|nr:T9SS type A sorting domain-containing protein [Bacteroidia bacterium]